MQIISIIGIVVGILVFIICCSKNVNLVVSGFLGALIILITSGNPILEGITSTWAGGFSGFIKSYFLIFVLGALFGKTLSASGGAKRIAIAVYHLCGKSKKNSKFLAALFVPIMYAILSYVGVSGFVIVYTVLDIAIHVFRKNDLPWRMYCYGGATCIATMILPGNMQLVNISAANIAGTTISSGALLGLIGGGLSLILEFAIIYWDVKRADRKGETFMDTGADISAANPESFDEDLSKLPNLIQSIIPILVMVLTAAVLQWNIIICVALGIACCFIVMPGRIKNPSEVIASGVSSAFVPILGVAAASAVGTCLTASSGYALIESALQQIPSVYGGCIMIIVMSFCTASSTGGVNAIGTQAFELFTQAGLTPATAHRLMMASVFTCIPPQSSGPVNAMNVAKIRYGAGIWCYIRTNFIGGGIAFLVVLLLVQLGIFV